MTEAVGTGMSAWMSDRFAVLQILSKEGSRCHDESGQNLQLCLKSRIFLPRSCGTRSCNTAVTEKIATRNPYSHHHFPSSSLTITALGTSIHHDSATCHYRSSDALSWHMRFCNRRSRSCFSRSGIWCFSRWPSSRFNAVGRFMYEDDSPMLLRKQFSISPV